MKEILNGFTREDLIILREKARKASKIEGLVSDWKLAYQNLMEAADYVDAMMARATFSAPHQVEEMR